jgi:hypothetical protein
MSHKLDSNFFEQISICVRKSNVMPANSSAIVFAQNNYPEFFKLVVKCIFQKISYQWTAKIYPKYMTVFYLE